MNLKNGFKSACDVKFVISLRKRVIPSSCNTGNVKRSLIICHFYISIDVPFRVSTLAYSAFGVTIF